MKTKINFSTGPWWAEPEEASEHRGLVICAKDAIVATITPADEIPLDEIDQANARLIVAAPAMYGKIVDTVSWLDREINNCAGRQNLIERLIELRDDLAETLRKMEPWRRR